MSNGLSTPATWTGWLRAVPTLATAAWKALSSAAHLRRCAYFSARPRNSSLRPRAHVRRTRS